MVVFFQALAVTVLLGLGCVSYSSAKVVKGSDEGASPLQILEQYGIHAKFQELVDALRHSSPVVRQAAAAVLGDQGQSSALPFLTEILRDENPGVRIAAALALHKLGSDSGLEIMRKALTDTDSYVRIQAAVASCKVGEAEGRRVVEELLSNVNTQVRVLAVHALEYCVEIVDRIDLLAGALRDPQEEVRIQALIELAELRDKRSIPLILDLLTDQSEAVRHAADGHLKNLTGADVRYNPFSLPSQREENAARWRNWWEEHRHTWSVPNQKVPEEGRKK